MGYWLLNLWESDLIDSLFKLQSANFVLESLYLCAIMQNNVAFNKPVRWGQFYYVDRFILLTSGFSFSLYKYYLDTAAKSDLQR